MQEGQLLHSSIHQERSTPFLNETRELDLTSHLHLPHSVLTHLTDAAQSGILSAFTLLSTTNFPRMCPK